MLDCGLALRVLLLGCEVLRLIGGGGAGALGLGDFFWGGCLERSVFSGEDSGWTETFLYALRGDATGCVGEPWGCGRSGWKGGAEGVGYI